MRRAECAILGPALARRRGRIEMLTVPETRYTRCGTINIAYQVFGEGPVDLVLVPGWVSNLDMMWEEPRLANWLRQLGTDRKSVV